MIDATVTVESPLEAPGVLAMTGSVRERLLVLITRAVSGLYGVPAPEDERDVPVTIVQEGTDEVLASPGTAYDTTGLSMPLAVARADLAADSDRALQRAQAHAMLAAIVQEMHADETFTGLADGIDLAGGGIQTELGKFVFAEASFRVRYHHLRGDPYHADVSELP